MYEFVLHLLSAEHTLVSGLCLGHIGLTAEKGAELCLKREKPYQHIKLKRDSDICTQIKVMQLSMYWQIFHSDVICNTNMADWFRNNIFLPYSEHPKDN